MSVTAQQLADEAGATIERATRVLPVAAQMVGGYAPSAPEALQDEATIRFASYLLGGDPGTIRAASVGDMSSEFIVNHSSAFRNCGAAALLTRFKVRRAATIDGTATS